MQDDSEALAKLINANKKLDVIIINFYNKFWKIKIQETVEDLDNQLKEEKQARKELQDRLSQMQDSYDRLQAEKRSIEDKYSQLSNQLVEEDA
jgi:chromosome segregation ATPase